MIGKTIGHYQIESELGKGGMGVVYLARDTKLNRLVALKFVSPFLTQDPVIRERFSREAQAAAAIDHPNICTIHDIAETDDGRTYIVMGYYGGPTLSELLKEGPVSPDKTRKIGVQIASALAAAHKAGIYHRDIKPGNIALTEDGDVKLLDFGLAKLIGAGELTKSGGTIGTVAYMSPEQIRGENVDHRADLWALGVVLYEMLTGNRPFRGAYEQALSYTIQNETPEQLTDEQAGEGELFTTLLAGLLDKNLESRTANAEDVLAALESGEVSASVPAHGSGPALALLERKHWMPWIAGGLIAVLVVVLLVLQPWAASESEPPQTIQSDNPEFQKIAVLPFTIHASPEFAYVREGLVDLLATSLDGAGSWRSIDSRKILSRSSDMEGSLSPEDAREFARSLGATMFLLGSATQNSDRLRISVFLYPVNGPLNPVGEATAEGSDLFSMADNIAQQILASVDGSQSARVSRVASKTTDSIDAFKAYLDGESAFRYGKFPAALEGFQRATELDSTFALAWYRVATTSNWVIRPSTGLDAAERAVAFSEPLSDRDKGLLLAQLEFQRGGMETTETLYREHLGVYPEETEAVYNLAELLFHTGPYFGKPFRESKNAWYRLLDLEPDNVPGLVHLARIAAAEQDTSEFLSLYSRIESYGDRTTELQILKTLVSDDSADIATAVASLRAEETSNMGEIVTMLGIIAQDESQMGIVWDEIARPGRSSSVKSMGFTYQSQMMLMSGEFERALELNHTVSISDPQKATLFRHYNSLLPFRTRSDAEIDQTIDELERWDTSNVPNNPIPNPFFSSNNGRYPVLRKYLLGIAHVRKGNLVWAGQYADELESAPIAPEHHLSINSRLAAGVRGRIAVANNNIPQAIDFFRKSTAPVYYGTRMGSPFFSGVAESYLLAELLVLQGEENNALEIFQSSDDASIYERVFRVPGLVQRAKIYRNRGDVETALELTVKAEKLYSSADAELQPIVDEIKDLKSQLESELRSLNR